MEYSQLTRGDRGPDGWAKTVVVRKTGLCPDPETSRLALVLAIAADSAAAIALQFTEMLLNVM